MVKVDLRDYQRQMQALEHAFDDLPEQALDEFRKNTPVRSGNARSKTRLQNQHMIVADYPYSQRLEDNWSPQTKGRGIIGPTVDWIEQEVDKRLKGI